MAEYTVKLGRKKAEHLANIMLAFRGGKAFISHRLRIFDAIAKVFPTLNPDQETEPSKSQIEEERDKLLDLALSPREQRALYEGFLSILNTKEKNGADDITVRRAARAVRLWGEVEKALGGQSSEEFDGLPDGEAADLAPDAEA